MEKERNDCIKEEGRQKEYKQEEKGQNVRFIIIIIIRPPITAATDTTASSGTTQFEPSVD
jgi:hypothetical protein